MSRNAFFADRLAPAARRPLLLLLALLLGCGGSSGPRRYDLSGRVTYDGEPVAAGVILLDPDTERGNSGPGTIAEIHDGRYRTPPGKGTVGGPHLLRITAGNGQEAGPLRPYGIPLLPQEVRLKVDLPRETSTRDLELAGQVEPPGGQPR